MESSGSDYDFPGQETLLLQPHPPPLEKTVTGKHLDNVFQGPLDAF